MVAENRALTIRFNSGIGLETCIRFAQEGASILMSDISGPAIEKAVAKLKELCPSVKRVETTICDVSKEASVEAMVCDTLSC